MTLHLKGAREKEVVRCAKARGRVRIDVGVGQVTWGCPWSLPLVVEAGGTEDSTDYLPQAFAAYYCGVIGP